MRHKTLDAHNFSLEVLRYHNARRTRESFGSKKGFSTLYLSNAAAGEMGEVCNVVKKMERKHLKKDQNQASKLGGEIADVIIYLDLLAEKNGLDLGTEIQRKFNIVSRRVGSKRFL